MHGFLDNIQRLALYIKNQRNPLIRLIRDSDVMNYWLVKFAPFRYSWQEILRNGKFEIYSVRNPQARNNLKAMQLGDQVLFYHSQESNCIMGKMQVTVTAHQDPTTDDPKWLSVTFEPIASFEKPISLSQIKEVKELAHIGLVKQPRLAVMPLSESDFEAIESLQNQLTN